MTNNREGHFIMANLAMNAHGQVFSCASCGCWLVLLKGGRGSSFFTC
ncbi:hypothetical protein NMP65_002402 [Salmonella enterica]|nr:hypothetical protein [Salmonella enterica subsp. enterica serovar Arechavaleta]EJL5947513.1 hypothetical protein [Salmonella enterica]